MTLSLYISIVAFILSLGSVIYSLYHRISLQKLIKKPIEKKEDNKNVVWFADKNSAVTIKKAWEDAQNYGYSGITKDGSTVTTQECVQYQYDKGQLVMSFKRLKRTGYIDIEYYGSKD